MKTNLLKTMGAAATMAFALSAPASSQGADYVKKTTGPLGIFDYTRVKHTEIGIVGYQTQRSDYRGPCGACTTVIQRTPVYGEVVTGKSLTISLHPKERRCLTSICSPCTTYAPRKCNPCDPCAPVYSTQPQPVIIGQPQPYQIQPRAESILTPVPERRQEPTPAPQELVPVRPSVPSNSAPVPPPIPEPPKENGPQLIIPREPTNKPTNDMRSPLQRTPVSRVAWN